MAAPILSNRVSELSDTIIDVLNRTKNFKSNLHQLESSLNTIIKPIFDEPEKLNKVLDRPEQETVLFVSQLENAKDVVLKCEKITTWSFYKSYKHSIKLQDLNKRILNFFQILNKPRTIRGTLAEIKESIINLDPVSTGLSIPIAAGGGFEQTVEKEKSTVVNKENQMNRAPRTKIMSVAKELEHLQIPLEELKLGTDNFSIENLIGGGGFGKVYKGKLSHHTGHGTVAVKRLDPKSMQGEQEFMTEISMLCSYRHPNLVSLIGYCEDDDEMILIYEYAVHGSLDKYLRKHSRKPCLTWEERLKICIGAASGLNYLHTGVGPKHRIIHRDVKSSNILLDENWEAKISDFGLSKVGPANQPYTFLMSKVAGTYGYCDPEYFETGVLTKESDVYSFGVVLFEILSGSPALIEEYNDERRILVQLVRHCFEEKKLNHIIDPNIREQIDSNSLNTYTTIAYQCLSKNRTERPTMAVIVQKLTDALKFQSSHYLEPHQFHHEEELGSDSSENAIDLSFPDDFSYQFL